MLDHLPESLDDTYLHVLRQIPQANKEHAHRMLQCLMVAVRPLRVEELAELLAFEFDESQGGIPKYRAAWRLDDQTQAVLSICSSLVAIVNDDSDWDWFLELTRPRARPHPRRQVVQFSHFSVKEFLMSNRLGDFSQYRIHPLSAHTVLTQACLSVLLHSGDLVLDLVDPKSSNGSPLAKYAAEHWVEHAQFEDVASFVKAGIEALFDSEPHFAAWVGLYDMDKQTVDLLYLSRLKISPKLEPNPLYYAMLCGFFDLAKHLVVHRQQYVNAFCGAYTFPLFVALEKNQNDIVELLLDHGANVNALDPTGKAILHKVFSQPQCNLVNLVKLLLKHGADVNARDTDLMSPLHLAEYDGELEVAQMLVKHKADVNFQDSNGNTPLDILFERPGYNEEDVLIHTRLLLGHGAEVNSRDKYNQHLVMRRGWFRTARILLEHGADSNAEDNDGKTLLHILSESKAEDEGKVLNHALLLLKHGAEVNSRDNNKATPLHLAIRQDQSNLAGILLEHGADADAENDQLMTSLHILSEGWIESEDHALSLALSLLKRDMEANRRDKYNETPLHLATKYGQFRLAKILLEHGADANAKNDDGMTPLQISSESRIDDEADILNHILLLLKHGAELNVRRGKFNDTPLHLAMRWDWFKLAETLLDHGADTNAENNELMAPLHILSEGWIEGGEGHVLNLALLLLKHGVEVNRRDKDNETPLHLAIRWNQFKLAEILLEHGADANAENNEFMTPLHILSEGWIEGEGHALSLALSLLKRGVEVNRRDKDNETPLHLAMRWNQFKLAEIFLEHGADADAENDNGMTPLQILSESRSEKEADVLNLAWLLLKHGAEVNRRGQFSDTPLHMAIRREWFKLAGILIEHGADGNAENSEVMTPLHVLSETEIKDGSDVINLALILLKHGVEVNGRDKDNETPLHLATRWNHFKLAGVLLEHGADANATNVKGKTPLLILSESRNYGNGDFVNHARLLLEHTCVGVPVSQSDEVNKASSLVGGGKGQREFTRNIINLSTDANKLTVSETSAQQGDRERGVGVALTRQSLKCGVDLTQNMNQKILSHLQSNLSSGLFQITTLLLYHGAKINTRRDGDKASLYPQTELEGKYYNNCVDIAQYLTGA